MTILTKGVKPTLMRAPSSRDGSGHGGTAFRSSLKRMTDPMARVIRESAYAISPHGLSSTALARKSPLPRRAGVSPCVSGRKISIQVTDDDDEYVAADEDGMLNDAADNQSTPLTGGGSSAGSHGATPEHKSPWK